MNTPKTLTHYKTKTMAGGGDLPVFELAILLVAVGLFIGAAIRYIQQYIKTPIPYTVVVLLVGIVLEVLHAHLGRLGEAIQLAQRIDPRLLLGAFIPSLIFESAFNTNFHIVRQQIMHAVLLAGPGVCVNTALTALFA